MPRRREFKGIANNLAELLSGRNNDYLGYWAVGQLFLLAQKHEVDMISLDLINCKGDISSPTLEDMCQYMSSEITRILKAHKLPDEWVKSISAKFSFNQEYQEKYHYWRSALGKPYLVQVEIETDLGYVNKATQGGQCKASRSFKRTTERRLLTRPLNQGHKTAGLCSFVANLSLLFCAVYGKRYFSEE